MVVLCVADWEAYFDEPLYDGVLCNTSVSLLFFFITLKGIESLT